MQLQNLRNDTNSFSNLPSNKINVFFSLQSIITPSKIVWPVSSILWPSVENSTSSSDILFFVNTTKWSFGTQWHWDSIWVGLDFLLQLIYILPLKKVCIIYKIRDIICLNTFDKSLISITNERCPRMEFYGITTDCFLGRLFPIVGYILMSVTEISPRKPFQCRSSYTIMM